MARGPVLQVDGARQLRRSLRKAGDDLTDLKRAHRDVGNVVLGRARGTAPRRSGRLAASQRVGATKTQAIVRAGGARLPYAGPIHWGWPARGIAPQPWLVEAAQSTEPIWTKRFEAAIDEIVRKIKGA